MRRTLLVPLVVGGVLLAACGEADGPLGEAGIETGSWVLLDATVDGEPLDLSVAAEPLTLGLDDTGIHGFSGCNTFSETGLENPAPSEAPADPQPVLPELMTTDIGCVGPDDGPAPVMELEAAYLDALRSAHEVEHDNGRLVLQSDHAKLELDLPWATHGTWMLQSGRIDGRNLQVAPGTTVSLGVGDGLLGGRAACNEYGAEYTITGTTVTVEGGSGTDMACEEPKMVLEAAYLDALPRITTMDRDGDRLVLLGDEVQLLFQLEAPLDTATLADTRWVLESLVDGETATAAEGDAFVEFRSDETMVGSSGCRTMSGEWTTTGSGLALPIFGLEGECTPDLADQDGFMVGVLEDMAVTIEDDQLTLTTQHGAGSGESLVFHRAN